MKQLRDGGAPQARQLCEACSNRPPHAASSTYVATPAPSPTPDGEALKTDVGVDAPPGATPGALFAVMDPSSCCCKADVISVRDADRVQDDEGAVGDGEGEELDGELPAAGARSKDSATSKNDKADHLPPVLWPPRASVASSREFGPVAHCLRLRSAYAQQPDAWGTGEPAFTSYHHLFKVTYSAASSTVLFPAARGVVRTAPLHSLHSSQLRETQNASAARAVGIQSSLGKLFIAVAIAIAIIPTRSSLRCVPRVAWGVLFSCSRAAAGDGRLRLLRPRSCSREFKCRPRG